MLCPLVLSRPRRVRQPHLSPCMLRIPLCGLLRMMSMCPRMPQPPGPTPPLLSVDPETGIVNLRGKTQSPTMPSPIPSDSAPSNVPMGMDEIPLGAGDVHPAQPPLIYHARIPKTYPAGFRWEALLPPKNAQETQPRNTSNEGATPDAKCAPRRGGHRESPPSSGISVAV